MLNISPHNRNQIDTDGLVSTDMLNKAPKKLLPRLNQLLNRAQLAPEEVHILRGVAKAMLQTAERAKR